MMVRRWERIEWIVESSGEEVGEELCNEEEE
jgi:hypothetical protein